MRKVQNYTLIQTDGKFELRMYADGLAKDYSVIEAVQVVTGKSLDGLRKHGAKMAKSNKVEFIDKTK